MRVETFLKRWIMIGVLSVIPVLLYGQIPEAVLQFGDYRVQPEEKGRLSLRIDNLSFFHDNEFTGPVMKGYTLPGLWLQPKLRYQPLENVRLELGLHALTYHGASKYPNYAYRDIAEWKGERFQKGLHVLPYFRAQLQMKRLNVVLGNLYGGSYHQLIEPLYTPELNLTADPEMGAQVLLDLPRFHLDAWVNWESFIFRQDVHKEAFTVGVASKIRYNAEESNVHLYTPVQILFQHRGGELDTITHRSISTLANAAVGFGLTWNADRRILKRVSVEADAMGYRQVSGSLCPADQGYGFYAQAGVGLGRYVNAKAGYFRGEDFMSLFGVPYFGTMSTRYSGATLDTMSTLYLSADYSREFMKMFAIGAQFSLYYSSPGILTFPGGATRPKQNTVNYSFGVYFRANMDFLLRWL